MTTPTTPHPTFRLPTLAIPSARSSSPRTRSKSLSLARSPLLPFSASSPLDHLALSSLKGHGRGGSLHHLPSARSEDDLTAVDKDGDRSSEESMDVDLDELEVAASISLAETAYDGPFQSLDRHEMMAVIVSFIAVGMLALAAGLTTIYDWVL